MRPSLDSSWQVMHEWRGGGELNLLTCRWDIARSQHGCRQWRGQIMVSIQGSKLDSAIRWCRYDCSRQVSDRLGWEKMTQTWQWSITQPYWGIWKRACPICPCSWTLPGIRHWGVVVSVRGKCYEWKCVLAVLQISYFRGDWVLSAGKHLDKSIKSIKYSALYANCDQMCIGTACEEVGGKGTGMGHQKGCQKQDGRERMCEGMDDARGTRGGVVNRDSHGLDRVLLDRVLQLSVHWPPLTLLPSSLQGRRRRWRLPVNDLRESLSFVQWMSEMCKDDLWVGKWSGQVRVTDDSQIVAMSRGPRNLDLGDCEPSLAMVLRGSEPGQGRRQREGRAVTDIGCVGWAMDRRWLGCQWSHLRSRQWQEDCKTRWRKRKPAPTRTTRPAGRGFWWVGNLWPAPVPAATCTHDPCELANPWRSLVLSQITYEMCEQFVSQAMHMLLRSHHSTTSDWTPKRWFA